MVQPPSAKRLELNVVVPVEDMTEISSPRGLPGPREAVDPADTPEIRRGKAPSRSPAVIDDDPARSRSIWPHVEERVLDLIEAAPVHDRVRELPAAGRAALCPAQRAGGRAGAGSSGGIAEAGSNRGRERSEAKGTGANGTGFAGSGGRGPPAELMAQAGSTRGAPTEIARAHHGSVSRQERTDIEEALKRGTLSAVVATSSLELGIDMGAVDLVIQVEAPPSVASGLQRIGRAGHNVGDISRGVIFPKYQGDLVQATVVAERMRGGNIEELRAPRNPLDVLAQQIVAMTSMDDWPVDELERVIRRAAPFAGADPAGAGRGAGHAGRAGTRARSSRGCGPGWCGTGWPEWSRVARAASGWP